MSNSDDLRDLLLDLTRSSMKHHKDEGEQPSAAMLSAWTQVLARTGVKDEDAERKQRREDAKKIAARAAEMVGTSFDENAELSDDEIEKILDGR